MKTVNKICIVVLTAGCSLNIFAQQQKTATDNTKSAQPASMEKIAAEKSKPTNLIDLWLNLGYSAFYDGLDNTKIPGGYGVGLGVGYSLEANRFRFRTGFEFDWLNSTTKLNEPFTASRQMTAPYPTMTYKYNFTELKETRNAAYVSLPLLFGAQFNRYYFLVGPKIGMGVLGNYKSEGTYDVAAYDGQIIDDLSGMPNHSLSNCSATDNGKMKFTIPNISLAAEFGLDLDEWLQYKPQKPQKGRQQKKDFRENLHYRVALFAEYGLLNTNYFAANNTNNGQTAIFGEPASPAVTGLNTMLGCNNFGNGGNADPKFNPLFVGVRFVMQYELPKKQPKPAPTPQPQPKPKPQPPLPTMKCVILNAETNERIPAASVQIFGNATEPLFTGVGDATGGFATELHRGTYASNISAAGYLTYTDSIVFIKDTITIFMQPLHQNLKITLHNVFFATNKTNILPESEPSLEDLFEFLTINDPIRVRIIGHTDAVGSDNDNQKLSEGRAKSVTEDMISRGIDASRIEYEGRGESEPVADNETEEGRAENRRVEVEILQTDTHKLIDIPDSMK